jgi:hypothetical protein
MDETRKFLKFKDIVGPKLNSVDVNLWCVRHDVEIIEELPEVAPIETFFLAYRSAVDKTPYENLLDEKVRCFIRHVGDRIAVSDNEDFAYLFPRDLYEKILVFGTVPD